MDHPSTAEGTEGLTRKALTGVARQALGLGALVFLPAWSFRFWQAWVFLGVFTLGILAMTLYYLRHGRDLLRRRMRSGLLEERQRSQKLILALAVLGTVLLLVVSALDHRFGWSRVPVPLVLAGDLLVALGLLTNFLAGRANTFASTVVEVAPRQVVVSTGPYAWVRHPMYAGNLLRFPGVALALGSWWGLAVVLPLTLLILLRLLDEERFLRRDLEGYSDYCRKVPHRLVPGVW